MMISYHEILVLKLDFFSYFIILNLKFFFNGFIKTLFEFYINHYEYINKFL